MPTYRAYGLGIRSELPLPELAPGGATEDVVIRTGLVEHVLPEGAGAELFAPAPNGELTLAWAGTGAFRVRDGREVVLQPAADAEPRLVRVALLGHVLSVLLRQRGLLVLHGSAVRIGDGAVAFVGRRGFGKSTLAATMLRRGHRLVTDDVLAVSLGGAGGAGGAGPVVHPGVAHLKLWPDSVTHLGHDPDALPRVHAKVEKRTWSPEGGPPTDAVPLRRLYLLTEADRHGVEDVSAQDAFVELHLHAHPFVMRQLQLPAPSAAQFRDCVALTHRARIRRLKVRRSLSELPLLASLIEEDVATA